MYVIPDQINETANLYKSANEPVSQSINERKRYSQSIDYIHMNSAVLPKSLSECQ